MHANAGMTSRQDEGRARPGAGFVRLEPDGEMHLVGYFLRALLERAIGAHGGRVPRGLVGASYGIRSEGMELTIAFRQDGAGIRRILSQDTDARVEAALPTLVRLLLGGGLLRPWLSGEVRARGKLWRLMPLLRLLRSGVIETGGQASGSARRGH